jgi:hypothetical protein
MLALFSRRYVNETLFVGIRITPQISKLIDRCGYRDPWRVTESFERGAFNSLTRGVADCGEYRQAAGVVAQALVEKSVLPKTAERPFEPRTQWRKRRHRYVANVALPRFLMAAACTPSTLFFILRQSA